MRYDSLEGLKLEESNVYIGKVIRIDVSKKHWFSGITYTYVVEYPITINDSTWIMLQVATDVEHILKEDIKVGDRVIIREDVYSCHGSHSIPNTKRTNYVITGVLSEGVVAKNENSSMQDVQTV